jgi:hypothetical protein
MKSCWAACLGDCSEKYSREHIISSCILPEKLTIKGFSWCVTTKEIFNNDLRSYCLCQYHNKRLSDLDNSAKDFVLVFQEIDRQLKYRSKQNIDNLPNEVITINALKFERWCLKILCNILYVDKKWTPPKDLVEIVFGMSKIPPKCGLGFVYNIGESIAKGDDFHIKEICHPVVGTVGALLLFQKWLMFCSWHEPVETLPSEIFADNKDRKVNNHINRFTFKHAKLTLKIDWSNYFDNDKSITIKKLRKTHTTFA